MHRVLVTVLLTLLSSNCLAQAQSSNQSTLPQDPAEIMAAAGLLYSPKLKPWHVKVSYQLYDDKGKLISPGSYDYWWASPDTYRSTWKRGDMSFSEWHVAGKYHYLHEGGHITVFERKLSSDLVSPLPSTAELDPEKVRLQKTEEAFGKVKLPCVTVIRNTFLHDQSQVIPMGLFPTYCFDPAYPMLRAYFAFGATSVAYNKIARIQGMYLAQEIDIYEGKRIYLKASVDSVNAISATAEELTPTKDAKPNTTPNRVPVSSGLATGLLVREIKPVYPQDAKSARVQGTVRLRAVIGEDGRVHDLSPIDGPSASLIAAAMIAVSQWQYRPYMLNGAPVEVETTVNVVYQLGL
ncbi:energy transducer TonB [Acidicapsa dinghuensis]